MARRFVTEFVIQGDSSSGVRATRELEQANADLTQEMQRAQRESQQMSESYESVSVHAARLAAISTTTTAAMGAMALSQTRNIANQAALANSLGVSVQALQQWDFAAQGVGLASGQIGDIFKDTAEKVGDFVNTEGGEAADLFEQLSLNVNELRAMGPDRQLLAIAQAFDEVGTRGQKIAFIEGLGNDATRLLPLLENNSALLKEQLAIADRLGVSLPQEDIESIQRANQALIELTAVGTGFANEVATQWAPSLVTLSEETQTLVENFGGMGEVVSFVSDGAVLLSGVLAGRLVGALAAATAASIAKLNADRAVALQAGVTAEREAGAALATARRSEAERVAAVNSATIAAQRAQSATVEAASRLRSIQLTQQQMAAERALETQRLQAQISATGRQQSLTRLAEIRRAEMALTTQSAAAQRALTAAEAQGAASTRMLSAAKVDLSRATAVTSSAVAANTSALAANTGAQRAMTAASRGAASALMLVGGPAGAALLAVGSLFYFREELGLVQPELTASADRVAELTGRIDDMSRAVVQNRIAELTSDLEKLKASFIEVTEVGSAADSQRIRGSGVLGVAPGETGRQGRAIQSAENGIVAGIQSPETLAEIRAHEKAIEELDARFESLGSTAITIPPILRENDEATKAAAKAAEEAARKYERFQNSLQTLQDKLFPLEAAQRQYREEQQLIGLAFARGEIGITRYLESMNRLEASTRSAKDVGEAYGVSTERTTQKVNQATQDLGFTFESAFENAILQGEGLRGVLNGILDDMARIALRETVTAPLGGALASSIGGLFGASTIAAGSAGAYGSAGFLGQVGFSEGGYTGQGTKFEPAGVVHRGEFVVKKSVVERPGMRTLLETLNEGRGYAEGGYVTLPKPAPRRYQGYAAGGYVDAPRPMPEQASRQASRGDNYRLEVHAPVTVQAAPGMSQEQAQQQGQAFSRAIESGVIRVLQRETRHGGMLYKR
ncbi:hypothetical protein [Vreelandella titanicae]|uniref:hypothetical protein n=1 Tax=Vreelandella titanicae TaxID=664683 RepID=UPI00241DEAFB|nr:hypothetical protein [Halomonas titanicae]